MSILIAVSNSIPVQGTDKFHISPCIILLALGKFVAVITSHVTKLTLNEHGQELLTFHIHMTKD